jgi:hypothetical protein
VILDVVEEATLLEEATLRVSLIESSFVVVADTLLGAAVPEVGEYALLETSGLFDESTLDVLEAKALFDSNELKLAVLDAAVELSLDGTAIETELDSGIL